MKTKGGSEGEILRNHNVTAFMEVVPLCKTNKKLGVPHICSVSCRKGKRTLPLAGRNSTIEELRLL
jgi:hypothetical protein